LSTIEEFCLRLAKLDGNRDDLVACLYELIDDFPGELDVSGGFEPIFSFMETYPSGDFGTPGPLVHLIENYYPKYVTELIRSLGRAPTYLTLWMANRILNDDIERVVRDGLTEVLTSVSESSIHDPDLRKQAKDFLSRQARIRDG